MSSLLQGLRPYGFAYPRALSGLGFVACSETVGGWPSAIISAQRPSAPALALRAESRCLLQGLRPYGFAYPRALSGLGFVACSETVGGWPSAIISAQRPSAPAPCANHGDDHA
jgi:hypothetical protein